MKPGSRLRAPADRLRARWWPGAASIAGRLLLLALLPATLVLIVANLLLYAVAIREADAEALERGQLLAGTLAEGSRYAAVSGNTAGIDANVRAILLADASVVRIEVLDAGRRTLLVKTRPGGRPEATTIEAPIQWEPLRIDTFDNQRSGMADIAPSPPLGFVRVAVSAQSIVRARARQLGLASVVVVLSAALAAIVGLVLAGRLREPLARVLAGIRDIRAGRFDTLPEETAPGELGELQTALKDMAQGLQLTQHRLETEVATRTAALQEAMERVRTADAEKGRLIAWSNNLVEDERRRISLEVHDDLTAALVSVRMLANSLATSAQAAGQAELAAGAVRIAELIDRTYERARDIVRRLRPEILDALGLPGAAQETVRHFDETGSPCRFRFTLRDELPQLDESIAITAYRILQEALSNVSRHSGASICDVTLGLDLDLRSIELTVADNGRGFDTGAVRQGLGLVGIRERLAALGGVLALASTPGRGTRLRVTLPITQSVA